MSNVAALNARLEHLHTEVRTHFPSIARIGVALHDGDTDEIRTFLYSPVATTPLAHYRTLLHKASWLDSLRRDRRARVINELRPGQLGDQIHSRHIEQAGFKASYTVPIFDDERFVGFVFFNADTANAFDERTTAQLDLFVHIIGLMIERALQSVATLTGSLQLLGQISRFRNDETGSHLSRMTHYSSLIARAISGELGRDDDWVEHVRLFAPMHDIGKITTPDAVLLKPGQLSDAEFGVIRQHPLRGEAILRTLLHDLGLQQIPHVESLLAIARHHHERWDGSGYPDGLRGADIPIEARIVAVADVFDALTTRRCYKPAWPLEQACAYLREQSGVQFDPRCVEVFLDQIDDVRRIRVQFPQPSTESS